MDCSNSQHNFPQEMSSETLESMLVCTMAQQEKKPKPAEEALPCPRCESMNTKFCYYNNYSLTQPRYFCKSCRRYWTKGGTLRNVPVGGGCRKAKRSSSKRSTLDQQITSNNNPSPMISPCVTPPLSSYDSTDLSLAFARLQEQTSGHYGFNNPNMSQNFNGLFVDESTYGYNNNNHHTNYGMMGMNGISQELGFEETVKQEFCNTNGRSNLGDGRVLRGFPWSGASNYTGEVDTGRLNSNWNNALGFSTWHGLLNSPLV